MNNELTEIYALRILGKNFLYDEPLFYNIESGKIIPIDICVYNGFQADIFEREIAKLLFELSEKIDRLVEEDKPTWELLIENQKIADLICSLKPEGIDNVRCIIQSRLIMFGKPEGVILCSRRAELTFKFKIVLLLSFSSGRTGYIIMPDDEGAKFCYGSNVEFPIVYKDSNIHKTLSVDKKLNVYVLKIKFQAPVMINKDKKMDSRVIVKNIKISTDVTGSDCFCSNIKGTQITVIAEADIVDKFGIYQSIAVISCPTLT